MKLIAVFLVVVYCSIAQGECSQACEKDSEWAALNAKCLEREDDDCPDGQIHPYEIGFKYAPDGEDWCRGKDLRCCMDKPECLSKKGGNCREDCEKDESEASLPGNFCPRNRKCCIQTPLSPDCERDYEGDCREKCVVLDDETEIPQPNLCSGSKDKCCVKNYECQRYVTDGVCRDRSCWDDEGEMTVSDWRLNLCIHPNYVCCFVPDACNYRLGTCRYAKKCPPGEVDIEDTNKKMPKLEDGYNKDFDDWCEKDDFVCCVKKP